jgi:hypothetical protein
MLHLTHPATDFLNSHRGARDGAYWGLELPGMRGKYHRPHTAAQAAGGGKGTNKEHYHFVSTTTSRKGWEP